MAREIICGIYKIENLVNGRFYIGSANDVERRWGCHRSLLRNNKHHSIHLQRAWNKHGKHAFKFHVVEHVASAEMLIAAEQKWIDSTSPAYNIAPVAGRQTGYRHTDETKAMLSKLKAGTKASEETKLLMSIVKLGKKKSEETKKRMSAWQKGRRPSDATLAAASLVNTGKKHTPEHIQKAAKGRKGRKLPPRPAVSAETRLKLSIAGQRPCDESTKEKISLAMQGKNTGPLTDEHKAKVSAALKGKPKPPRSPEHTANWLAAMERKRDVSQ